MSSHFYVLPYKKMLLATFLLYLVVVRLDPGRVLRSLSLSLFFFSLSVAIEKKIADF